MKILKTRKQQYGTENMVGKTIETLRKQRGIKQKDFIAKMQAMGVDINPTSYSKLEGQIRKVSDMELMIIAKILELPIESLFPKDKL